MSAFQVQSSARARRSLCRSRPQHTYHTSGDDIGTTRRRRGCQVSAEDPLHVQRATKPRVSPGEERTVGQRNDSDIAPRPF